MKARPFLFAAFLAFAASHHSLAQSLTLGLVAHYELDGNGLDSSGNDINASLTNTAFPTFDRFGNPNSALRFDPGVDAVSGTGINLANSSSSISLWLNKLYVGNLFNGSWILRVGNNGAAGEAMHVAVDYGQSIRYSFFYDDFDINTPILPANEWHHLAFTFDNNTNERKIYADGNLVATNTAAYDFIGTSSFAMGLPGTEMDDIRFYNRVLSATEVQMAHTVPEPSTAMFGAFSALIFALRRNRQQPVA